MVCHRADRQADLAKYPKPQFAEAAGCTGRVNRSFIVSACLISAREISIRLMASVLYRAHEAFLAIDGYVANIPLDMRGNENPFR